MIRKYGVVGTTLALLVAASCAQGQTVNESSGPNADGGLSADGAPVCSSGPCDQDGDGVQDGSDKCANTPSGAVVNSDGCADTQLTPQVEPMFPSYGLTWTPTGDLGKAGGLTWTYTGIQRGTLFHIYWVLCEDPATPCGISLNGPIDAPSENWELSAPDSDLPNGKLVFTNTTSVLLADSGAPPLSGRLTVTIVDASDAKIPFVDVATLGVTARVGKYGAEIIGTGFKVMALAEVQDPATSAWTPYKVYYDAAATPDTGDAGGNLYTSFGGSFYDK
ncbi:MAG: hypothetical protein ABIP89_17590 [Polyangiaceae bacterium]